MVDFRISKAVEEEILEKANEKWLFMYTFSPPIEIYTSVKSSLNLRVIRGIFWGISALQKDLRSYGYARFLRLDLPQNPCLAGRQVLSPYPSFKR